MHLFLKLHQLAAARGDGLRPEWLELMTNVMSADGPGKQLPPLTLVQPGNHPDGVSVVPPAEGSALLIEAQRKATA